MTFLEWANKRIQDETIFRYLVKRRVGDYTPYEIEKKFSDQTSYQSSYYKYGIITEVIETKDDYLIEFLDPNSLDSLSGAIYEYYFLSEIRLNQFDCDNIEEVEDFYDGDSL